MFRNTTCPSCSKKQVLHRVKRSFLQKVIRRNQYRVFCSDCEKYYFVDRITKEVVK